MKKLLSIIIFTAVLSMAVGFCVGYYWLPPHLYKQGYFDGYAFIKPIEDLQQQVGCAKIDGKFGPCWRESETQAKYEIALGEQYNEQTTCSNVRDFDKKMLAGVKK